MTVFATGYKWKCANAIVELVRSIKHVTYTVTCQKQVTSQELLPDQTSFTRNPLNVLVEVCRFPAQFGDEQHPLIPTAGSFTLVMLPSRMSRLGIELLISDWCYHACLRLRPWRAEWSSQPQSIIQSNLSTLGLTADINSSRKFIERRHCVAVINWVGNRGQIYHIIRTVCNGEREWV